MSPSSATSISAGSPPGSPTRCQHKHERTTAKPGLNYPQTRTTLGCALVAARRRRLLANSSSLTFAEETMSSTERSQAALEARRVLASQVHSDWTFEDAGQGLGLDREFSGLLRDDPTDAEEHEGSPWIERVFSSDSEEERTAMKSTSAPQERDRPDLDPLARDVYKFDNPDDVSLSIKTEAQYRRRKRRQALDEELTWNISLRHWTRQRDAWTGGRARLVSQEKQPNSHVHCESPVEYPPISSQSTQLHNVKTKSQPSFDIIEEVPLAPPILSPQNAIRAATGPVAYSQIYSKVVLKSLSPTVPINLRHMTAALVEGWKENGEWPPRATVPEPMMARRRKKGSEEFSIGVDPASPRHRHLTKGVGVVKKALGLNHAGHSSEPKEL